MRITNQMMTNNVLSNINKNKNALNTLSEQYSTGKKIQTPSEDPTVAVRALRLRSNLTELNQYYEKNIPDAKAWMDVTETALTNVNTLLRDIYAECVEGSNDTLATTNRESIVANLTEMCEELYAQGDASYAGRYVFTGYRTDTSLTYNEDTSDTTYTITEEFSATDMEQIPYIKGAYELEDYDSETSTASDFEASLTQESCYRVRLSYDNLDSTALSGLTYTDAGGNVIDLASSVVTYTSTDDNAYDTGSDGMIHYIADTGELILPDDVYSDLTEAKSFSVTYRKTNFEDGDLRPENYFDCTAETSDGTVKTYTKTDQDIVYNINFGQSLTINTQASDSIQLSIGRTIEEIIDAVNAVAEVESKISEVEELLEDTNNTDEQTEALNQLLEQMETELTLKSAIMQKKFEAGITEATDQQEVVNVALADLGSRYNRLELTKSQLGTQQTELEELISINEDADLAETIINYTSVTTIYNASLSAAAKLVQNTLLDFI